MEKIEEITKENEAQLPNDQRIPIGFTSKTDVPAFVTFQQLFDLMRVADTFSNLVNFIKQENFNKDLIRYYFEEDLVDVTDKDGKVVMVKNAEGKEIAQKTLRTDFWNNVI